MCGIYGFIAPKVSRAKRALLSYCLALSNDTRGGDSWGVIVGSGSDVEIVRGLGDLAPEIHRFADARTIVAHTRYATTGEVTPDNAHPFEIGRIVGAHNGMVHNHRELAVRHGRDFAVDSMHLVAHLDAGLPFDDVDGYGALEWLEDRDLSTVHLCRLQRGELAVHELEGGGVVWSSNAAHLREALRTAGLKSTPYRIEEGLVYQATATGLYQTRRRLDLAARETALGTRLWPLPSAGGAGDDPFALDDLEWGDGPEGDEDLPPGDLADWEAWNAHVRSLDERTDRAWEGRRRRAG